MIRGMTETTAKLARLRALSPRAACRASSLTRPATVAWLTGGATNVIDRSASTDAMWIAVGPDDGACISTVVEGPRLHAEFELPFEVVERALAGSRRLPARGRPGVVGPDAPDDDALDDDLTALRLALVPEERERLAALGADATAAVEGALRGWRPGATDRSVMAGVAARLRARRHRPVCLIVGGDDRLERLPASARRRLADAPPGDGRAGRHAARAARRAHPARQCRPTRRALATTQAEALQIEAAVLDACCETGLTYGDVLARLAAAYGDGRWQEHWQGGPIGYRQREFEIAPAPPATRWHTEPRRPAPRDRLQPERRRRRQGRGHVPGRRRPPRAAHREHRLARRRGRPAAPAPQSWSL